MSDILAHLLFYRGIEQNDQARIFLSPDYERDTHDPFLLKDAEKSAARFIQGVKNNERIAIYSDYDADGIPGAAMFYDFFQRIGYKNFSIYIPHRHDEGFGLNVEAVEQLAGEGVKLLITIDCGISDIEPVKKANEKGLDVVITDHHEAPPVLPPAFAIIDHKQKDCAYPDKNICGSAVAFKLIQAILKKERFGMKEGAEKWLLDLVGIATMSDMVPLTGENRVFSYYGLMVLRKSPRKGLVQLLSKLKIAQSTLSEDDIAFMVTPRINAASRMGVPRDAFDLLVADNDDDAYRFAVHLDEVNNERKGVVASLVKEVKKKLVERHGDKMPGVIVLGNPEWRPSLLGLVASSCVEEYDRPVFLWGRDGDNIIKGSCRGDGDTHVVDLMHAVPVGTFTQFGGHHHSGGFAVANDSIYFLEQALNKAKEEIGKRSAEHGARSLENEGLKIKKGGQDTKDGKLKGVIVDDALDSKESDMIDLELDLEDIDWNIEKQISQLAPFGIANPKPLFLFRDIMPDSVRIFGKANNHVELIFKRKDGRKISAISFFEAGEDWAKALQEKLKTIDLIASIEKSNFRGRTELRLRVVEVVVRD